MLLAFRALRRPTSSSLDGFMCTAVRKYGGFPLFEHKATSLFPDPEKPALSVEDPRFDQRKRHQSGLYIPRWTPMSENAIGFDACIGGRGYQPSRHVFTVEEYYNYFSTWEWYEKYSWKFLLVEAFNAKAWCFYYLGYTAAIIFSQAFIVGRISMQHEPIEQWMDREEFFDDYWWITRGHHVDKELYEAWLEKRRAKLWRGIPFDDVKFHGKNLHEVEEWAKERRKQIERFGKGLPSAPTAAEHH